MSGADLSFRFFLNRVLLILYGSFPILSPFFFFPASLSAGEGREEDETKRTDKEKTFC